MSVREQHFPLHEEALGIYDGEIGGLVRPGTTPTRPVIFKPASKDDKRTCNSSWWRHVSGKCGCPREESVPEDPFSPIMVLSYVPWLTAEQRALLEENPTPPDPAEVAKDVREGRTYPVEPAYLGSTSKISLFDKYKHLSQIERSIVVCTQVLSSAFDEADGISPEERERRYSSSPYEYGWDGWTSQRPW